MFAITRSLVRTHGLRKGLQMMQTSVLVKQINMKVVKSAAGDICKNETVFERSIRLGRPMSPHMTIYRVQLTSAMSILHRITGVAISVMLWSFGIGALMSSHDISHYVTMFEGLKLEDPLLTSMKGILVFPVAYHTVNGIRHLLWDFGHFLKISEVYATGYGAIALSILLAAGLCMLDTEDKSEKNSNKNSNKK